MRACFGVKFGQSAIKVRGCRPPVCPSAYLCIRQHDLCGLWSTGGGREGGRKGRQTGSQAGKCHGGVSRFSTAAAGAARAFLGNGFFLFLLLHVTPIEQLTDCLTLCTRTQGSLLMTDLGPSSYLDNVTSPPYLTIVIEAFQMRNPLGS